MRFARPILAVLLAAMAAGQLADVGGFVDVVETYRLPGGTAGAWLVAVVAIVGEAAGAVLLFMGDPGRRALGGVVTLGVAVGWTLLGVSAFVRGLVVPNCGCFGVYLTQDLDWTVLVQDAVFVAEAAWVAHALRQPDSLGSLVAA